METLFILALFFWVNFFSTIIIAVLFLFLYKREGTSKFLRVSCFGPWSWSNKEEEEEEEEEEEKDDDDHKKKRSHTPHTHIVFLIRGETLTLSSVCF